MTRTKEERRQAVLEVLNEARSMELHAIYQYMNHHYSLDDANYGELAAKMKKIAIDEMKHAEDFAERIKDLDGEPTTDPADRANHGHKVGDIFRFDAGLEDNTLDKYNYFLQVCRDSGDSVSALIFERIIGEEQEHFNYFDDTDTHIKTLGAHYLATLAGGDSE